MLATVKGIYENGRITLEETPPSLERSEVLVTFTKVRASSQKKKREFGIGKGIVKNMSADFDEPLDDLKEYM
ncbi:DUF2281 domain-containing protein [Lacihabitans soyangensis]|uniref:DUF2281 domain-containing protein n=1 Tax=Lacihabitans soyangensis TaxID=869394 RepID=A0AAE3KSG6_9BACT|nr:DUF2281 domain-containing protein [Lacihabitans soyangensis]MCP9762564.1 DUF2281 domain-containing protein [Lacihabitans soyangensis]